MAGKNRLNKQNREAATRGRQRQKVGEQHLAEDIKRKEFDNDWNLGWFKPLGLQQDCIESFNKNVYTVVDGVSGCGKTSVSLWWSLSQLKMQKYQQLVFIKNPTEVGDDQIGYLSGSETDKLVAHMDTTKRIFHGFVSKNKLENDISKDKVRLTIPNFLLGATLDNAIVIIDEAQTMSPNTIKLLTERCGTNTKYIILGDSGQTYSIKKRANGFEDFINRTTITHQGVKWSKYEPFVGYIKMNSEENRRSDGSAFINRLYETT